MPVTPEQAGFTGPEAGATRAALQAFPFLEGMVPSPVGIPAGPDIPITPEDYIRSKMTPLGIEPQFQGDLTKLFRGENLINRPSSYESLGKVSGRQPWDLAHWALDPDTASFFGQKGEVYPSFIRTSEAARALNVIPSTAQKLAEELSKPNPDMWKVNLFSTFADSDVPPISEIKVRPESHELLMSGRGESATAQALSQNVKALEAGIPGTGTPEVKPNPLLKAGRGFLKTLGRVIPWAGVAGGALAAEEYEAKDQDVRKWLAAASTYPGWGTIPFAAEQAINLGEWMGSPLEEVSPYPETPAYIGNNRDNNMAQPYVSHSGREYSEGFPITPGAGFTAEIPFLGDYTVQPEQLGLTPELMDDLIAYNDKLARLSKHDPLYRETGIGQPAVDLGPGIPDQYHTLGGQLTAEFSPLPTEDLVSQARWYQRASEPWTFGYGRDADANVQGIMMGRGGFRPATGIIDDAIRENILQIPEYTPSVQGWRPGLRGRASITDPGAVGDESMASTRRNSWRDIVKRVLSPMSTAQAGSGFVPGKSVTVEVEQTPEEDFAITEALMQLDEPRIPFSLPPEARGVFTEEVQAPFILDDQPDPYTSITTLPIGDKGWTPTLLSDTLGGPATDQPRTNLDGTITYLTNAEAMASEVQRALDRAGRIGPTPPVTSIESQLQALTELAQTDPTIADRYTTPGSQDLIDIATQVESFADIPEALPEPEPVSSDSRKEQRKEAAKQKERDKKAAAKREAADKRAADKAAAKSARMSAAQKRNIARVAKASRKAEAKREAATKKRAQEQRDKLDSASKKALQDHMAWMATQTERLAKEEKKRAKRYAGGTGGALMWT
jgi:hypothetical protein